MKLVVVILFSLIALNFAIVSNIPADFVTPAITPDMVNRINGMHTSWKAGYNEGSLVHGASVYQVKLYLGALKGGPKLPKKTSFDVRVEDLPTQFDSRTNWPNCWTIKQVRDQSACGTCWAFGAAEAISDRYCTYGVDNNLTISAADIGFCCGFSCGDGCNGGYPSAAWEYWQDSGVVNSSCYPYPFPSCDHHIPDSKNPCPSNEYPNPDCPSQCSDSQSWDSAKHYASSVYNIDTGENDIMSEIYSHGPVETAFSVYSDFPSYKSGVYQQQSDEFLGGHAVKIIGWGVEGGLKYWLIANSWNPNWGDQGYFKILKGVNECGIEDSVNGGVPKN